MSVAALLHSRLTTDSGVSALVGSRVYGGRLPPEGSLTLPAISYFRVSNGPQLGSTDMREARYQIDCWAEDYPDSQSLAAAVKTALEEWTDTDQSPAVKMCRVVDEGDLYEDDPQINRVVIDVMMNTIGD